MSGVDALLTALDHPLAKEIAAARKTLRAAAKGVEEIVKWNAPTFTYAGVDFATLHVREQKQVLVIFHAGAKAKGKRLKGAIADPAGLLVWRGEDRALAGLGAGKAFAANLPALAALTRAWIAALLLATNAPPAATK